MGQESCIAGTFLPFVTYKGWDGGHIAKRFWQSRCSGCFALLLAVLQE